MTHFLLIYNLPATNISDVAEWHDQIAVRRPVILPIWMRVVNPNRRLEERMARSRGNQRFSQPFKPDCKRHLMYTVKMSKYLQMREKGGEASGHYIHNLTPCSRKSVSCRYLYRITTVDVMIQTTRILGFLQQRQIPPHRYF